MAVKTRVIAEQHGFNTYDFESFLNHQKEIKTGICRI